MKISLIRSVLFWRGLHRCQPAYGKFSPQVITFQSPSVMRLLCSEIKGESVKETAGQDTVPKVKKTVHNIVDYISIKVQMKFDRAKVISVVSYLISESIPPQHIAEGILTNQKLLGAPAEKWQTAVTVLKNFGFKTDQIMPILHSHHDLFDGDTKQLYSISESLRHIGYHDGALQKLICKDPTLLELTPSGIVQQFSQLRETFKAVEIIAMALESPSILHEDFTQLKRKIVYVKDVMGIDYEVIAKCYVLGFPFLKIKSRHLFLERAGLYKKPDPKKIINYENPSLSKMVRFSNKRFAKKLAGMTVEEYRTFEKMVALEEEEGLDNDSIHHIGEEHFDGSEVDSDYDEDSDDEDYWRDQYKKKNR